MNKNNRSWFKKKPSQINLNLVNVATNFNNEPKYGYYGFKLYFPESTDDETKDETLLKYVLHFENFIKRHSANFSLGEIEAQKCFVIDYKLITSDEELSAGWKGLETEIITNTDLCLSCMGLAMHQFIMKDYDNNSRKKSLGIIRARLINYEPIQQIKDIRVNNYGRLISLKGTVIKAANVKIMYQYMAFSCATCTGIQVVKQPDNIFTVPNKCLTEGCKARSNFQALHSSPFTRTISWQHIKIQELIGNDEFENGRVPRTLECELTEDLVNSCVPGDDVTITGVIKVRNNAETSYKNKEKSVFLLYLDVVSVVNNKNQNEGTYGASERITFNITDYYAIQKIHAEPYLFRFLVQSLCPTIYGHEIVKAGLLLALFGGTKSSKFRAESHVLMVGDPGIGKSQMLHACVNVAPRGVYVCGNTSTGSGLTVTMTREAKGEYSLEAGALMLADQGCCCIDEFDKMPTQHACLLEVMEQQSISIAKAGIVCTLPTRATILAAANPAGGHYNKAKTIAENLKISSPMLSRFDLVFILLDQPNEDLDMRLSEHILALHSRRNGSNVSKNSTLAEGVNNSLRGRLSLQDGEEIDYLPHSLFRKYIAYAQKYVNPQLSDDAKQVLKDFYFQLRKEFQNGDSTPVTTRQLNSLMRLTQARAKAELREEATKEDAQDVVEIMRQTLIDIFTDNVGILDTTRSQNGAGMSGKNQVVKLLRLMQQKAEEQTKSIFTTNEIRNLSQDVGINPSKFFSVLQSLNIQGFILNKGANRYQLVTADL
ncbi:DNA helicase MCM8 [Tribolium castaneum]|uniref:DNA helicase MCM8 n=1 Tax=Tribolium castaneum TaxID=7070 RepID=D6WRH7_TRICA|nr:PREDICTED: DNA helicase MCM8 [Tribolium castaneum]EFA06449.1 DNA replication licensing factor REC-like Protein [Tribolium castaneum]|eukprot:XP_008195192.1 PREDICTED: DNA helicase MCM8 [Tribolium castaneum]